MERPNLYDLKQMCGKRVTAEAEEWAHEQKAEWPYGLYSPNDFTTMFEKGYLHGYVQGYTEAVRDFGIYRDGVQRIGCLETPIKEVLAQKFPPIKEGA